MKTDFHKDTIKNPALSSILETLAIFLSLENGVTAHVSCENEPSPLLHQISEEVTPCFRCCSVHVFLFEDWHAQGNKGEESLCLLEKTLADSSLD